MKTEHKAVLDTMRELERQGFSVTYLDVQENGLKNCHRVVRHLTLLNAMVLISVYHMGILRNLRTFSLKNAWLQTKFLREKVLMIV